MKQGCFFLCALFCAFALSAQKPELIFPLDKPDSYVALDFLPMGSNS